MDIKTISRTAAIMYADTMSIRTTNTIKRKFIESIYINNGNEFLTISDLIIKIEENLGLIFEEKELKPILREDKFFVEYLGNTLEETKYNLQKSRYRTLSLRPIDEIEYFIDSFLQKESGINDLNKATLKDLIYRYLHSVLNTNIAMYSHIIGKSKNKIPSINSEQFTNREIDIINRFIKWDDNDKNKALFKLVNYSIEYAVVVNNSSEDVLNKSLKHKVFFLDNCILYRALGINGINRKKRTLSFLSKCKASGQCFVISRYTIEEFKKTIEYHLDKLSNTTPFGRINPTIFKIYSGGDGFYQFYHEWRNGRENYGFDQFKAYITLEYKKLISEFNIKESYDVPFDIRNEPEIIHQYKDEIMVAKKTNTMSCHLIDARNMYWIECIRKENNIDVLTTKYYFITSDQKLQDWDNNHSYEQPLTLLPSQWMGLILKYVSRSVDDYKSFVSFMNIPKDDALISDDNLQDILAGISEITEDFSKQALYVRTMVETKFESILKGDIQNNAKQFAKDKLEENSKREILESKNYAEKKIKEKEDEILVLKSLFSKEKENMNRENEEKLKIIQKQVDELKLKNIENGISDLEKKKAYAEDKTRKRLRCIKCGFYGITTIILIICIFFVLKVENKLLDKLSFIVMFAYPIICFLFSAWYGKSLNPFDFFSKIEEKIKGKLYTQVGYDQSHYSEFLKKRERLNESLKSK